MKVTDRSKHSSLLCYDKNYERKRFIVQAPPCFSGYLWQSLIVLVITFVKIYCLGGITKIYKKITARVALLNFTVIEQRVLDTNAGKQLS